MSSFMHKNKGTRFKGTCPPPSPSHHTPSCKSTKEIDCQSVHMITSVVYSSSYFSPHCSLLKRSQLQMSPFVGRVVGSNPALTDT